MNIDAIANWNRVGSIASQLPEAEPGTSYGTPAFKVKNKLFARLREDGSTLVVYTDERDKWMKKDPSVFFITEHYRNYPSMLVNLKTVTQKDLKYLLVNSWKLRAPKRLLSQLGSF